MVDENLLIDIEALSHFKAKQDLEYAGKFKSKDESTDLKGAVRYDAPQVLTKEEKAQARANIGVGEGGETVVGESEIIVVAATLNEDGETITITEADADIITNYTGEKPMYLRLDPLGLFFKYITTENCFLCCLPDGFYQKITTDAENLVCHLETVEPTHYSSGETIFSNTLNNDGTYISVDAEKDCSFPSGEWSTKFVFGSEKIYTVNELLGYAVRTKEIYVPDATVTNTADIEITADVVTEISDGWAILDTVSGLPIIAVITESIAGQDVGFGFSLPSNPGTYLIYADKKPERQGHVFCSVSVSNGKTKPLDEKFIPDTIARKDEVPMLDANGKVPSSLLPSFVDDVVEGYFNSDDNLFYEEAAFSTTMPAEKGKIYVDLDTGNTYRFTGSIYVRINPEKYTIATNADIDALFE